MTTKTKLCLAILLCVLIIFVLFFRLMTHQEVEEQLSKRYGQEFIVITSKNISSNDMRGVLRAKVFVVSPKDNPEVRFLAFNTIKGGSHHSIPYISSYLQDTYSLDIFLKAFQERAANTNIEYTFNHTYYTYLDSIKPLTSDSYVNIESISLENLEIVCIVLSQAYADTFEKVRVMPSVSIRLHMREPKWDKTCPLVIYYYDLRGFETDAKAIQKHILNQISKCQERPQQTTNVDSTRAHLLKQMQKKYGIEFTLVGYENLENYGKSTGVTYTSKVAPMNALERVAIARLPQKTPQDIQDDYALYLFKEDAESPILEFCKTKKYILDQNIALRMPLTARRWAADDGLEKFLSESGAYIQLTLKLKDNLDTKTYAEQILDILHSIGQLHCNLFIQARANNTNIFYLQANVLEDYDASQYTLEVVEKWIKHRLITGDIPKKSRIDISRQ